MIHALTVLLVLAQSSGLEIATGGDDGLTQRFAEAFRSASRDITLPEGSHPITAVVEQVKERSDGNFIMAVTFTHDGKLLGSSTCIATEDLLALCAEEAVTTARRFRAKVF